MIRLVWGAIIFFLVLACAPESPVNKFSDETFIRIADFQDRRLSDSLYEYLSSSNPHYREAAALAFASIQDTTAIVHLEKLVLSDTSHSVRIAAAFALGQTGGEQAYRALSQSKFASDNDFIVSEAIGKTLDISVDTALSLTSWGLYRLALRGPVNPSHIEQAIQYLKPEFDENTRLGAAHFFSRTQSDIGTAERDLLQSAAHDASVFIRMASAGALRKIKTQAVLDSLRGMFNAEKDYRVRISIVRALQTFPIDKTVGTIISGLDDRNVSVAIAASEVLRQVLTPESYQTILNKARSAGNWRVRATLYEALLATAPGKELSDEIIGMYGISKNPYEQAALINALRLVPSQFLFVHDQLLSSEIPVIRTSATLALTGMNRNKSFDTKLQPQFLEIYKDALKLGDAAVIGIVASALADSVLGYKSILKDFQFLYDSKQKLTLPKDNEALQPLEAAIAYFEGRKEKPQVKNEFNHPIDWNFVKSIRKDQRVLIHTEKGDIEIQLLVEEAPGSVANFLQLAQSGYFSSKNFHRVVPNFVIQGGCNRGDGWGSEDYSIRSEFTMRKYKEGSVGMASAGKDTEGTQWFITHSPTPHLDGKYTLFAEVVSGMDVVHSMEVGNKIISIEVMNR